MFRLFRVLTALLLALPAAAVPQGWGISSSARTASSSWQRSVVNTQPSPSARQASRAFWTAG